jgi:hypothetical protein
MHFTLLHRCGKVWLQEFHSRKLNVHETVETKVPELLPADLIQKVAERTKMMQTYHPATMHANNYLLGGFVSCSYCGYRMFGQTYRDGMRYYRHVTRKRRRECPRPVGWVNADVLEEVILSNLFDLFGNPEAMKRAVAAATPDTAKVDEARARRDRLLSEREKVRAGIGRVVGRIADGTISKDEAAAKMEELREREEKLSKGLDEVAALLDGIPSADEVDEATGRVAVIFGGEDVRYADDSFRLDWHDAVHDFERMSQADKRALVVAVFGGTTPTGERMGISIEWPEGCRPRQRFKPWRFKVLGRLVDNWGELSGGEGVTLQGQH